MVKSEIVKEIDIKDRIFTIRGVQVMLDRDLAELYGVETKVLNQAVKRNQFRFPENFRFVLSDIEKDELVTNCDRFKSLKHSSSNPSVFSEQGVAMISAVLKSATAIDISIRIMDAFVSMRHFLKHNVNLFQKFNNMEQKQVEFEGNVERKFQILFKALESKQLQAKQGVFFNGQVFEAYKLVSDVIRSANKSIVLIDNYVDDTVLILFSKRKKGVKLKILTKNPDKKMLLDIKKFNEQFPPVEILKFDVSHDRFMIVDNKDLYHFGASLKDLGKKWFAFSKMDIGIVDMLKRI